MNAERLEEFLSGLPPGLSYAFEFRDPSWHCDAVYDILKNHSAAFCVYDIEGFTTPFIVTADFTYVRLHGPQIKYAGSYDHETLQHWREKIAAVSKL